MSEAKWYLRTQDETFGPETERKLVEWARLGRIQPGQEISDDNVIWRRVEEVPFLDMRFSIDIGDGNPRGPFNRAAADALLASGRLPPTASIVETRAPFEPENQFEKPQAEEPKVEEQASEAPPKESAPTPETRIVEKIVEVPVEKVVEVEKIVEVPVEKIVEKIVEKEVRVEVPVEKIVEKIVVDDARIKELEGLLEEERRHSAELAVRLDDAAHKAAEAAKRFAERESALVAGQGERDGRIAALEASERDAAAREQKLVEQVKCLEDELRRLPQAASEVADIQAAIYGIISEESEELSRIIDMEKREFEDVKKRYFERADRLSERRRELLKRSGGNIEEMTRKALLSRPEDPRAVQLRKDLDELRWTHEQMVLEKDDRIRTLNEQLRLKTADAARVDERQRDITQLRNEAQELRERLQAREKELMAERQRNEEMSKRQAMKQQALLARLASLESPSIGSSDSLSTNQSREAKQVKLPGWLHFK